MMYKSVRSFTTAAPVLMLAALAMLLLAASPANAARPVERVYAAAQGEQFWVGLTVADGPAADAEASTGIRRIETGTGTHQWQEIGLLPTRVRGMVASPYDAIVIDSAGQWHRVWQGQSDLGRPLPAGADLLAMTLADGIPYAVTRYTGRDGLGVETTSETTSQATLEAASATTRVTTRVTPRETTAKPATGGTARASADGTPGGGAVADLAPATAATAATAPGVLRVYVLRAGRWTGIAQIPDDRSAKDQPVAMAAAGGEVYLMRGTGEGLVVSRVGGAGLGVPGSATTPLGAERPASGPADRGNGRGLDATGGAKRAVGQLVEVARFPAAVADVAALDQPARLTLWVRQRDGRMSILTLRDGALRAVRLTSDALPHADAPVAAALVAENLRVIYVDGKQLLEQAFDPLTGKSIEPPRGIGPATLLDRGGIEWVQVAMISLLLVAMLLTMRSRTVLTEETLKANLLRLAPLYRRAAAGLVDLAPVLAATAYIFQEQQANMTALEPLAGPSLATYWIAIAVYLLHTFATEAVWGKTIGKWLFRLRVIGIDGTRPTTGQIALRNFFRLLDVQFIPLLFIFLSPSRQRIGDAVARTIVVTDAKADADSTASEDQAATPQNRVKADGAPTPDA